VLLTVRRSCNDSDLLYFGIDVQVYNTALLINADCRTIEALTYIDKMFNPANFDPIELRSADDETDEWLRKLFEGTYWL